MQLKAAPRDGEAQPQDVLRLVAVEREHLEFLRKLRNDPEMTTYLTSPALPLSRAQQEQWFEKQSADRQSHVFIAECGGAAVGYGQLHHVDHFHRSCEIGCHIGKEHQGRGLGRELVNALLEVAMTTLGLHRVYLHVLERNRRAITVYEACGFRTEGTLRGAAYKLGRYENVVVMSILAAEYEARHAEASRPVNLNC